MAPQNLRAGSTYSITIVTLITTTSPVTVIASLEDPSTPSNTLVSGSIVLPSIINGMQIIIM